MSSIPGLVLLLPRGQQSGFGQDMTGHDTTPCTLEEVLSVRGVALSSETPLIHE